MDKLIEELLKNFKEKRFTLTIDEVDQVVINGLPFDGIGGVRILVGRTPAIELVYTSYDGDEIEYEESFYLKDIRSIQFYKHHDPEYYEESEERVSIFVGIENPQ